jgi:arsenite methyltransferase
MGALKKLGYSQDTIVANYSETQEQTKDIFGFKWAKRDTYESPAVQETIKKWLFERYCANDKTKLSKWLGEGGKIILDAGCGSGNAALLFFEEHLNTNDYLGVDISNAVDVAKSRFAEKGYRGDFLQASITDLPFPDESIDMIFSEGVLHHTDSTEDSMKYLARKVKKNGYFLFYVYVKKAEIREFTDDFIREKIKEMSDEEAWNALMPLSKLGKAMGELEISLDVPEDIPYLGIKKGKLDIQRFFYWNVFKLFYRPDFNLEEMNHINFDWYRPLNCHRHTPDEVKRWCQEAGFDIEHLDVQEAGISVVAKKK